MRRKSREYSLYMAKLSGKSNRFYEMMRYMREVVKCPRKELNFDERNLFNFACENLIGTCREPLAYMTEHLISDHNGEYTRELFSICSDIISLIDDFCIPTSSIENMVNFYQIKGDCKKYLAEIQSEQEHYAAFVEDAYRSYLKAYNVAKDLHGVDPTRIAIALKISTFWFTFLKTPRKALAIAKTEYEMGAEKINELPESSYRETAIQLRGRLLESISVWEQEDHQARLDLQVRLDKIASRSIISPCLA